MAAHECLELKASSSYRQLSANENHQSKTIIEKNIFEIAIMPRKKAIFPLRFI